MDASQPVPTPASGDADKLAGARKGLLALFSGAKTDEEVRTVHMCNTNVM